MESSFTAEFFVNNRRRLRELFAGKAPIVLTANGLLQRNNDMPFPFRQDANFWYLTGIDEPDLVLVMDKEKEYLIVPERDWVRQAFDGSLEHKNLIERSGIATILDNQTGWKQLGSRLTKVKHAATLSAPAAYIEHFDFYTNPSRKILIDKIKEHNSNIELLDLREHFAKLRMIKQPEELAVIQKAVDTTVSTLRKIKTRLAKWNYEYEVDAFISSAYRSEGFRNGYGPIVASGGNACTLHYEANQAVIDKKGLLLIDTGAEASYYTADISRTYSFRAPTKRQQAVYQAVLEAQDYGFELLRAGKSIKENEVLIEQFIGEKLRELGLIKTINRDNVRKYYPHALSHYLGIDAHDAGDYSVPLKPGMVLTVEPGIYIPEEGIGIRIEDDVLITPKGIKVLSRKLPRELW